MSGLNAFLESIQIGQKIVSKLLGDGIFSLALVRVMSYYQATALNPLTEQQQAINSAWKAARVATERNYAQTSVVFWICDRHYNYKLANKRSVAVEQLRVCHLLVNCYNCLNGDQACHASTFGCSAPSLEAYLQL